MQCKQNNRTKLLAAVMVFAMAFAGIVVMADSSDAADVTYINGTINADTEFGANTTVVVDKDLRITNGASLEIKENAKFTVNEGVTVTIDGASTTDEKDLATLAVANTALVNINGTISVGEKGVFMVGVISDEGATVSEEQEAPVAFPENVTTDAGVFVSGTVSVARGGTLDLTDGIVVKSTGSISVTSVTNKISNVYGNVALNGGASISVRGEVPTDKELNVYGYEIQDEKKFTSYSSVTIEDATNGSLMSKISDITVQAKTTSYSGYAKESKVTLNVVDLTVSGTVQGGIPGSDDGKRGDTVTLGDRTCKTEITDKKTDGKVIDATSKIVIENLTVGRAGALVIKDANVDVTGTLTLVKGVDVANGSNNEASGKLTVEGKLTVTGTVTMDMTCIEKSNGTLRVTGGAVVISDAETLAVEDYFGKIYGATYVSDKVLTVCDLDVAMAAADGVKVLEVSVYDAGETKGYVLSKDITVLDLVTLTINGTLSVSKENTVTVDTYGNVIGGTIDVKGKVIDHSMALKITDESGIVKCQVIKIVDDGETQIFTSMEIALGDAVSGETIKLVGPADIEGTVTIPVGVTIDVNGQAVTVKNDSELIVNGVVDATSGELKTVKSEDSKKKTGVITVNNIVLTASEYNKDTFNAAGVYTNAEISDLEGDKVVNIDVFVANATEDDSGEIFGNVKAADIAPKAALTIANGAILTVDNMTVTKNLTVDGTLVAKKVTVDASKLDVTDGTITSVVAAAGAELSIVNIENVVIENVVDEDEGTSIMSVSGTPVKSDEEKAASLTIVTGSVTADGLTTIGIDFTVNEGTTLVAQNITTKDLTVNGTVDVQGTIAVSGDLSVLGNGNFAVAEDATSATANNVYIGIASKDIKMGTDATAAGATVTGKIAVTGLIYVKDGNTVNDDLVDGLGSVRYVVDGANWITVYGKSASTVNIAEAPENNAKFVNWIDKDGKTVTTVTLTDGEQVVTAKMNYNIYSVDVVADNGIGSVAIDGNVLVKVSNTFSVTGLKAGTHTVSFDEKYGFDASGVKMTVNGQAVSGFTFTLSGTSAEDTQVSIVLSGTTTSEPVQPSTDNGNDGMGITDYLLIVLVVMVVILAIVVIARMFRS